MTKTLEKQAHFDGLHWNKMLLFRKLSVLLITSLLLFSTKGNVFSQNAQPYVVTGTITEASTGNPLPGVNVVVKGTTVGTISDVAGYYTIKIPGGAATLVYSFVGYNTQEIQVTGPTTQNISFEAEAQQLNEVVVVGYGTQKKATVTGAIVSVTQDQLLQAPTADISNALTGRMSGILTQQTSGLPGSSAATIRIRGIGTFTGSADPLILVDGIEVDNYNNIDPHEIESISVLKDASATAVYGVRGANGAIIITTKRGTVGKPQISFSAQYATQRFTNILQGMNAYDYATSYNLAKRYDSYITGGYSPAYSDEAIQHYKNHDDPIFYPDVDWYKYMFDKNSGQMQYNVNINGGTDKVKYFVSAGYFDQDGLINHTDLIKDYNAEPTYKRYNIRSNFDFTVTKRFTINLNLASQIENRTGVPSDVYPRIFEACWAGNPVDHPRPEDVGGRFVNLDGALTTLNPIDFMFINGYNKNYQNYLNSSMRFNYDFGFITKGLTSHATVSYNNYNQQDITYSDQFVQYRAVRLADNSIVYVPQNDPSPFGFDQTFGKNRKVYVEAGLNYDRSFGDHNVTGLILYNQSKLHDPNLAYLVPHGYQGLVGRVTYNYKNKYLAEFNMGYNGTENFAIGKRFGFFPAYSLGWVPTEESFFPKNNIITYLKIRGSYGVVGNDRIGGDRFLYRPTAYTYTNDFYHFGEIGSNYTGYPGSLEGPLGNPALTWERSKKSNIGGEMFVLKGLIKLTGDYFVENRDNILARKQSVPNIVAATLPAYNLGKMKNSGYELEIQFNNKIGQFNYWIKGNFTQTNNVIEYQDEVTPTYPYQYRTGQRYGQYFGFVTDGYFNSWAEVNDANRPVYSFQNNKIQPGDLKIIDVNGDGVIDYDDQVPIGYSNFPGRLFGFSFGGDFKGFDFSVLFQGASDVSVLYSRSYVEPFLESREGPAYMLESWSQERYDAGLPINFPRFNQGYSTAGADNQSSDQWIVDGSYLRLKTAEIGYTLPKRLVSKVGMDYLRVYVNGYNLATWSGLHKGLDPESAVASSTNDDPYPVTRTINFGFNVKF